MSERERTTRTLRHSLTTLPFFGVLFFVCILFHARLLVMPDHTLTFDSWWYLYDRLRDGVLPQWNPYSLLGRLNVQWNLLPFSIFTPALLFSEFTMERFWWCSVVGTFAIFSVLFLFARGFGYKGVSVFFAVTLVAATSLYQTAASFVLYTNYMFCVPLATLWVLRDCVQGSTPSAKSWVLFIAFFFLGMLGTRTDILLYGYTFVTLLFTFYSLSVEGSLIRKVRLLFMCGAMVFVSILTVAWQFPFVMGASLDNARFTATSSLVVLSDTLFWKHFLISLSQQLALFISIALLLFRVRPQKNLLPLFLLLFGAATWNYIFSVTAFVQLATGIAILFFTGRRIDKHRTSKLLASLFLGIYVTAELFIYFQEFNSFTLGHVANPLIVSFCLVGFCSLCLRKSLWWLGYAVASYIFLGTSGVFFLHEVAHIPWLPERSDIFIVPVVFYFLLAGLRECGNQLHERKTPYLNTAKGLLFVLCLASLYPALIPSKNGLTLANSVFGATPVSDLLSNAFSRPAFQDSELGDAWENSRLIRQRKSDLTWNKRVSVIDTLQSFGKAQPYNRIFPSYLGMPNDATKLSSDLPTALARVFPEHFNPHLPAHPEYRGTQFYKFKKEYVQRRNLPANWDYGAVLAINPYAIEPHYTKEILAVEGGQTSRFFVHDSLRFYESPQAAYQVLKERAQGSEGLHKEGIVTTDTRLKALPKRNQGSPVQADIKLVTDEPELLTLQISSNKAAFLSILDLFDKGWTASVNGSDTPVYQAFLGTRVVPVPKGESTVTMTYRITGLLPCIFASLLGWMLALCLIWKSRFITGFFARH